MRDITDIARNVDQELEQEKERAHVKYRNSVVKVDMYPFILTFLQKYNIHLDCHMIIVRLLICIIDKNPFNTSL